jgi:hypothetical protein
MLLVVLLISCPGAGFGQKPSTPAPSVDATNQAAGQPLSPVLPIFHEDWNSITLENSTLPQVLPPVRGMKDDIPGTDFTRELWQVAWRPGDPLDLYVILPKNPPKGMAKPPVILYLYSFPTNTDHFRDNSWCQRVTFGGYAAVGFVSALTGHRLEYRPMNQWFVSELQESLATSAHDVQMVLNYLATRGDLDMDHVGMYGEGSGGSIAILAAAADARIQTLNVLNPWGDWPDFLAKSKIVPDDERPKYVKPEFLAKVAPLDPVLWLPKVKSRSLRVQNVRTSPVVPVFCEEKIEAAAPEKALVDQFGDGNVFFRTMVTEGRAFAWLKDQILKAPESATADDKSERRHYYPSLPERNSPFETIIPAPPGPLPKSNP